MLPSSPPPPASASAQGGVTTTPLRAGARNPFSLLLVILVNLVPLAGVFWLGWSVWTVMLLFWIENILTGAITLLRMLISCPALGWVWLAKLFMLPFFVVHYGLFCAVHLVFLMLLFGPDGADVSSPFTELARMPDIILMESGLLLATLLIAAGLLLRMLIEFVLNGAYRDALPQEEMFKPYGRIAVLHVTIIVSAVLVLAIGQPKVAVLVLIGLKLAVELGYWSMSDGETPPQGNARERWRALTEQR